MNPAIVAVLARSARSSLARRAPAIIALGLFVPCACGVVLSPMLMGGPPRWITASGAAGVCGTSGVSGAPAGGVGTWDADQTANAAAIIAEGKARGLPPRAWVIAVATAMQESTLRNLTYGDRDSVGLFQQRPSQGWGSIEQILQPNYAAGKFYERLVTVAGWEQMPLWQAAQRVQASAFPMEYQKHEAGALALVEQLAGVTATTGSCSSGALVGGLALPLPADRIVVPLRPHHDYPAVDIGVPVGTPVYAITGGAVRAVEGNCGIGVQITAADGAEWIYCHGSERVAVGGDVQAGDLILISGNTGASTGPHLHVQVKLNGGFRCPQSVIEAIHAGQPAPATDALPVSGCVG